MAASPAGQELQKAAIQGGPSSLIDEGCLRFQLQQQLGPDHSGSLPLPGQRRITNRATTKSCFCQAVTGNSGSLSRNGVTPGRCIRAIKQRRGIALCQPLLSHEALTSSGAIPAALALLFQSPLQQQQQTEITVLTAAPCFHDSCNYTHKHLLPMLPWNLGQNKSNTRRHSNMLHLVY